MSAEKKRQPSKLSRGIYKASAKKSRVQCQPRIKFYFYFSKISSQTEKKIALRAMSCVTHRGGVVRDNLSKGLLDSNVRKLAITAVFAQWWIFEAATVRVGKR